MTDAYGQHQKSINRRDFLKITAFAGLTMGLGVSIGRKILSLEDVQQISETYYLMGTIINFTIMTPDRSLGHNAIRRTVDEMKRLIAIFDYRQHDTPLARLNRDGSLQNPPTELLEIIDRSLEISVLSKGAFDITVLPIVQAYKAGKFRTDHLMKLIDYRNVDVDGNQISFARPGMAITLDGIAKGRVVDAGVSVLKSIGFDNVLVEAGGDMMASSSPLEGEKWRIAINHPRPSTDREYIATFHVRNKAVTTSGDYLNYFSSDYSRYHIIDPRTGNSPSDLASATVIASSATEADTLSTALMVLGTQAGLEFIDSLPDVEGLLVTRDLQVYRSSGFPA